MAIPIPSLNDQTSYGPVSQTFGGVSYAPPPMTSGGQGVSSQALPLAVGAVVVAAIVYYKWGR